VERADANDTELVEAARAGDRRALDALLARHERRIYDFGLRMCRHPADAEDVLQETLVSMARGVRDFRGASSLSTWLYAIARSHCIKKRRRGRSVAAQATLEEDGRGRSLAERVATTAPDPEESAEQREVRARVRAAIEELPPGQREVLVLRDVEGLTAPEVAQVLGIRVDAVKSRLHRARVAVRERLAPLVDAGTLPPRGEGCPDIAAMLSRSLEGDLTPERCAALQAHATSCARCRAVCDGLKAALVLCRTSGHAPVPDAVHATARAAIEATPVSR
jgi:RNA polymerase sigma-70 factor (ECF subfamily)